MSRLTERDSNGEAIVVVKIEFQDRWGESKLESNIRLEAEQRVATDSIIKKVVDKLAYYEDLEEQGGLKVQVHGQWEIFTDEYDCEYMLCTACGGEFYPVDEDTVDMTYNYCPKCGAKMDEVEDD